MTRNFFGCHLHGRELAVLSAVLAAIATGCQTTEPTSSTTRIDEATPAEPGFGFVQVFLTDAPGDIDAINICFREIVLVFAEDRPHGRIDVSRTIDVNSLRNGVVTSLGIDQFPVGVIQMVKLILCEDGASVVIDGVEHSLKIPSSETSGFKMILPGGFLIEEARTVVIILDFDASRSLHFAPGQGWMLTPVVQLVEEAIVLAITDPSPGDVVSINLTVRGTVASAIPIADLRVNWVHQATIDGLNWSAAEGSPHFGACGCGVRHANLAGFLRLDRSSGVLWRIQEIGSSDMLRS